MTRPDPAQIADPVTQFHLRCGPLIPLLRAIPVCGLRGEGLVQLIGAVVCLSCCAACPLVRDRVDWMAAYRAAVPLAHANQLPLPRF